MSDFSRYFHTLRHLKAKQLFFQTFYFVKKKLIKNKLPKSKKVKSSIQLRLIEGITPPCSYLGNGKFCFLNKTKDFGSIDEIDWSYSEFGKLWCYNLNYFDYINQQPLAKEAGLELIYRYIDEIDLLKDGLEPYPISLRNINWIKFLNYHKIQVPQKVNDFLYSSYQHLSNNLEYHLLGNHLIENGFSLLFGAYYFKDIRLLEKAKRVLENELEEQVLEDGGHFELSPMYHQVILLRLLDCINLVKHNPWIEDELLLLMTKKASLMLGWLKAITFINGMIPMVNDSTEGIAPLSRQLFDYAERLGLRWEDTRLGASGYRMIRKPKYELMVDVGNIGPGYIPGHAHSDTFNFLLNVVNQLIIVDTGISTYEKNERRQLERSTLSHNTVEIEGKNQSEVWSGFRVGKRAKIIKLIEENDKITSTHDGYMDIGAMVERTWKYSDNTIIINDCIQGSNKDWLVISHLHFHPNINVEITSSSLTAGPVKIQFEYHLSLKLKEYLYAEGFNRLKIAQKVEISFKDNLVSKIEL